MEFITEKDIKGIDEEYYKTRWVYFKEAIEQMKLLGDVKKH